jgi:hypothetical protein
MNCRQLPPSRLIWSRCVTDRTLLSVLVVVAMLRVLFFVGAFPLFNNVDEVAHIDLVLKREMGVPAGPDAPYAPATRDLLFRYGTGLALEGQELRLYRSPEYVDALPPTGAVPPPVWMAPLQVQSAVEPMAKAVWAARRNHEASEPPLYYAIAALWARIGRLGGLGEARLLYWVRAMDALIVGGLVILAARIGRACDPQSRAFSLGLPLLVAAFPQKVFYSITNDALSPLVGGLATYCGLRLIGRHEGRIRDAVLVGATIGLSILTKLTNVLLLAMVPLLVVIRLQRGGIADAIRSAGGLAAAIALPLLAWHIGASSVFGAADKAAALGWTYRPLAELGDHPIFTPQGAWVFLSRLLTTFWRGELTWHGVPLALPAMDAIYVASSLGLFGASGLRLVRERRGTPRRALLVSMTIFTAGVFVLAALSMIFDFGDAHYPSRTSPFFTSGRLIGAALLPFAAAFVYGLEALLARTRLRGHETLVILNFAVAITVAELALSVDVLGSPYNWFQLP